jgi:hypothetical protein
MRNTIRFPVFLTLLFSLCLAWSARAQTVTCPTPPNKVNVTITATVTFDASTNLFTYQYTVANAATSQQEVADIAIDFATPVSNIVSPFGWTSTVFADRNTVHWKATAAAPLASDQVDVGQAPPGLFQVKPGTSLSGFSFQSPNSAGPVNSYALGFVDIGAADTEADAEAIEDSCPQSVGGFFDLAFTGSTRGPVQFIPVQVDIKPGEAPNAVNPRNQGVTPVAILSSSTFDATQIDPATVRFGNAGAAPTDGGHVEDVNNDGLPDLVFQFPTPAAGILCGDTSETLTGKTLSGTPIQGTDSVVTVSCKK